MGGNAYFWPFVDCFAKCGSGSKNEAIPMSYPPYLLRLNFPNLEGIEIEVISDDFFFLGGEGALKLDVQKMAKIPF